MNERAGSTQEAPASPQVAPVADASRASADERDKAPPRRLALWLPTLIPPLWRIWPAFEGRPVVGWIATGAFVVSPLLVVYWTWQSWQGPVWSGAGHGPFAQLVGLMALLSALAPLGVAAIWRRGRRGGVWLCRTCLYPRPERNEAEISRCPECGNRWWAPPLTPRSRRFTLRSGVRRGRDLDAGGRASGVRVAASVVLVLCWALPIAWSLLPLERQIRVLPTPVLEWITTGPLERSVTRPENIATLAFMQRQSLPVEERIAVGLAQLRRGESAGSVSWGAADIESEVGRLLKDAAASNSLPPAVDQHYTDAITEGWRLRDLWVESRSERLLVLERSLNRDHSTQGVQGFFLASAVVLRDGTRVERLAPDVRWVLSPSEVRAKSVGTWRGFPELQRLGVSAIGAWPRETPLEIEVEGVFFVVSNEDVARMRISSMGLVLGRRPFTPPYGRLAPPQEALWSRQVTLRGTMNVPSDSRAD